MRIRTRLVRPHRRPALVTAPAAAAVAAVVLLTGCGGNGGGTSAASSSEATSSSAAETSPPDLASGLLPADAFGPGASVRAVSPEQLKQGTGFAATAGKDLRITPAECAAAVKDTQPSLDAFDDVAAETATVGTTATVEMLVRGGPIKNAVAQLAEAATRCPQAQVTSPQIGQATITFQQLPVPDLGDGAAALEYTTTATGPDGSQMTIPSLVGGVQDGDRLVMLIMLQAQPGAPGAALDPTAFTALLQQAHETQADALG
jgi:hypothetical protein